MSTAPAWQAPVRTRGIRPLLMERAAILLRRMWQGMGRAWARRRQMGTRPSAGTAGLGTGLGAGMSALLGRALTGRRAGGRMLAVEERLALGPKQHLYVVRCGEQRLLLASAAEGSLQWMALPEEQAAESGDPCDNTHPGQSESRAVVKRRSAKPLAEVGTAARRAARRAGVEGAR